MVVHGLEVCVEHVHSRILYVATILFFLKKEAEEAENTKSKLVF